MCVKVLNLIWEHAPYRGNTLLCFLALGDWSNDEGYCWPKMETLARKSRQSVRNAHYAVEQLCRDGFLAVDVRPGRGHKNDFHINMQKLHLLGNEKVQPATAKGANSDSKRCKTEQRNKEKPSVDPSLDPSNKTLTPNGALKDWLQIKDKLGRQYPGQRWIRSVYFYNLLGSNTLLLSLPPNQRLVAEARASEELKNAAREWGYSGVAFTRYPTEEDLLRLELEYPEVYSALPEALKRKYHRRTQVQGREPI